MFAQLLLFGMGILVGAIGLWALSEWRNRPRATADDSQARCNHGVLIWRTCKDCAKEFASQADIKFTMGNSAIFQASTPHLFEIKTEGPRLKMGQWVRVSSMMRGDVYQGHLARVTAAFEPRPGQQWRYAVDTVRAGSPIYTEEELVEPIPRNGEWWEGKQCPKDHDGLVNCRHACYPRPPHEWLDKYDQNEYAKQRIKCGCIVPVNFGLGGEETPCRST